MRSPIESYSSEFFETLASVDEESRRWLARHRRQIDWETIGLIVVACLVLTFLEYFGGSTTYKWLETPLGWLVDNPGERIRYTFREGEYARLARLFYWSGCTLVGYLVVPVLYVGLVMSRPLKEIGLGLGKTLRHLWIYLLLFVVVLPAVYAVSLTESFQSTYPFYTEASRSWADFLLWELAYAVQFLSLEFFFRGFLVHGLKHRFGVYSVLVSVVPYCMIHFGKPMPETIGAVFAGIALGLLSLYTRSIWLGVAIHVSVALSMDVFSLIAQGEIALPF